MKVNFIRKPLYWDLVPQEEFVIEKVVILSEEDFNTFLKEPLESYDFISLNDHAMYVDVNKTWHVILVRTLNSDFGILVNNEGTDYARYAARVSIRDLELEKVKTVNEKLNSKLSIREWIGEYNKGSFDSSNLEKLERAGWQQWLCSLDELKDWTKKAGAVINNLKENDKLDFDNYYIKLVNKHTFDGEIYSEIRIADKKDNSTVYRVIIDSSYEDAKYAVYSRDDFFDEAVYRSNDPGKVAEWFNGYFKVDDKIIQQIIIIRDTGLTNMFDSKAVLELAIANGFDELITLLNNDVKKYTELILYGEIKDNT